MESDRELLRALKARDGAAFDRFFREYQDRVYGFVAKLVGRAAAEDVTQEVFVEAYRGIEGFRGRASLKTWLFRIAVHVAHKHRRRLRDEVPLEAAAHPQGDPVAEAAARGEWTARLGAALDRLPDEMRETVLLSKVLGFTYAECAEVLGCPVGTVKSRLSNAMTRLREMLGEDE